MTILDVAREAGVSKSAVSLALRGDAGLGKQTRSAILATAQRLGYRRNRSAASLVQGRTGLVGVLLTDLSSDYQTEIVHGIEDAAEIHGLEVVLSHGRRDAAILARRLEQLVDIGVEGVVVMSAMLAPAVLEPVAARVPMVVVGRVPGLAPGIGSVANDDEVGARLAVEHLLAMGHQRIAHLTMSARAAARARRAAYEQTMVRAGHAESVHVVAAGEGGAARLVDAVVGGPGGPGFGAGSGLSRGGLLAGGSGPTAVFASNDRGAVAMLGAALDAGLRVPQDLSIVGYDNSALAQSVRPALTSVDQPRPQIGRMAMEQLATMLGGGSARREVVAPSLVVRASTSG